MLSFTTINKVSLIALLLGVSPLLGCVAETMSDDEATAAAKQADVAISPSLDFGGAFGYVGGAVVNNPATDEASCPTGYTATKVLDTSSVDYPMHFCSRPHQLGVGAIFDFGGMWGYVQGAIRNNPITGAATCPAGYADQKVLDTANVDYPLHVCYKYHVANTDPEYPFGGMWGYVNGVQTQNPATGAASCSTVFTDSETYGTFNADYGLHFCWLRPDEVDFGGAFGYVGGSLVPNPATQAASCPQGYNATQVLGTAYVDWPVSFCSRPRQPGVDPVYDFGGMWGYVEGQPSNNPITGATSCPAGYTDQQLLGGANVDPYELHVCFKPHAPGTNVAYHFGGMWGTVDATTVANPATAAASCPAGYIQRKALHTTGVDFPLYFCWQLGAGQFSAESTFEGYTFVHQVQVNINPFSDRGSVRFSGLGGGLPVLGASGSWGTVTTDDLLRLANDTVSYEINSTAYFTNVNFFDANSNNLGSYVGGGVGAGVGVPLIGGGTGTFAGSFTW